MANISGPKPSYSASRCGGVGQRDRCRILSEKTGSVSKATRTKKHLLVLNGVGRDSPGDIGSYTNPLMARQRKLVYENKYRLGKRKATEEA